jgi:elongation factor G
VANTDNIRNIVLLGHAGSGKTSLAESILHKTGASNRLGSVDDKTSICDYYDEEKEHQHSIGSAVVHANHAGKLLNIIDTPGSPDFVGPAIQAIAAAETAVIVISATAGIETNTRRLSTLTAKANMPRIIVINKIDADNIDLPGLLKNIQESFGTQCRCANLPSADKASVIDCIENETGDSPLMDVAQAHTELIESVIEADDDLMESYLGGEEITAEKIASVFVEALKAGTIVPIVFTNSRKEVGVNELLDIIVKYTPAPTQAAPAKLKAGETETELKADPAGPLAGLVFRTTFDPRSNMKYSAIRVFSGTLKSDTNLLRNDEKKGIRPGHILKSQGGENKETDIGIAGDIVTLAKVDELRTGDLVHNGKAAGQFEQPPVPEPMYSLALEPATRGDEQKISSALDKLCEEDPCFKIKRDQQTKELVASGLGDLHLRVMLEKMESPTVRRLPQRPRATTATKSNPAAQVNSAKSICESSRPNAAPTRHSNFPGTSSAAQSHASMSPPSQRASTKSCSTVLSPASPCKISAFRFTMASTIRSIRRKWRFVQRAKVLLRTGFRKQNRFCSNRLSISK